MRASSAQCSAAPSANDVLPCPGRARDDRQRRRLEPEQQLVEIVVPGGNPDDRRVAVVEALELEERLLERRVQRHQRVGGPSFGDLEDQRLGAVERVVDVVFARERHLLDVGRGADQAAQHRELRDDLRVVRRVRRCGRGGLDPQQRLAPAERFEVTGTAELLGHRDRVDRFAPGVQRRAPLRRSRRARACRSRRFDVCLDRGGDRLAAEHHRSEERLLDFEVVRWDPGHGARRSAGDAPRPSGGRRLASSSDWTKVSSHACQALSAGWRCKSSGGAPAGLRLVNVARSPCGSIEAQPCDLLVENSLECPQHWGSCSDG